MLSYIHERRSLVGQLELYPSDIASVIATPVLEVLHRHFGKSRRLFASEVREVEIRIAFRRGLHVILHVGKAEQAKLAQHHLNRYLGTFCGGGQNFSHSRFNGFICFQARGVVAVLLITGEHVGLIRCFALCQLLSEPFVASIFESSHSAGRPMGFGFAMVLNDAALDTLRDGN